MIYEKINHRVVPISKSTAQFALDDRILQPIVYALVSQPPLFTEDEALSALCAVQTLQIEFPRADLPTPTVATSVDILGPAESMGEQHETLHAQVAFRDPLYADP